MSKLIPSKMKISVFPILMAIFVLFFSAARVIAKQCKEGAVQIHQVSNGYGPDHVPEFRVQILNASPTGTFVFNVHVSCGEFASKRVVNPHIFRRIPMTTDCIVNDGKPLAPDEILAFSYTNSRAYNLVVSHVDC